MLQSFGHGVFPKATALRVLLLGMAAFGLACSGTTLRYGIRTVIQDHLQEDRLIPNEPNLCSIKESDSQ